MSNPLKNINKLLAGQRTKAVNVLRVAAAVSDAETVTIGGEIFEVSLISATGDITSGNIEVNLFSNAIASQGTLSMATIPTANDTLTIDTTVYTFKASASASGEVNLGANAAAAQANLVAAVAGDALNSAHPTVTMAAFAANDAVITAIKAGVSGDTIVTTETFTPAGDVFDAGTLGTTTAGADPTAEEFIDGVLPVINASSTKVTAVKLGAAALLLVARDSGPEAHACTETLAGTNNVFAAAAMYGGRQINSGIKRFSIDSRVPNATEVTTAFMVFAFPFPVAHATVSSKVTSTNAKSLIDPDILISGNNVILNKDGATDFAATDTVTVIAFE